VFSGMLVQYRACKSCKGEKEHLRRLMAGRCGRTESIGLISEMSTKISFQTTHVGFAKKFD